MVTQEAIDNPKREASVALIRSAQSLKNIEEQYRHGQRGKMDLRSYFLQPYHQEIIDILARDTGKAKAEVVRELIDEWCELRLKERNRQ